MFSPADREIRFGTWRRHSLHHSDARPLVMRSLALVAPLALAGVLVANQAWAGPPFLTDDPEPVEVKHWEFYAASQWTVERHAAAGTLPHIEANYGALPGLQLHAIVPAAFTWTSGATAKYGLGDTELGAKLRFFDEVEGEWRPQVGIFPLVILPTGAKQRGLGEGAAQALLPLWVQKSFGPWTTYGGGGLHLAREGNAVVLGWLLQRAFSEVIAGGAEAFVTTPLRGEPVQLQLNLGTVINVSDHHHLLLSAGPSFRTDAIGQAYVAYQLTI